MKPTIEQLQDALRRYNEGIQYLTENPKLSQDERDDDLRYRYIQHGLCYSIRYIIYDIVETWVERVINEKYNNYPYWIQTPILEERDTQIELLTKRRDKLIEIIKKYDQL